jgi:hypothetical protein
MQIYIFKNNVQAGPFDEKAVLDGLRRGEYSPDDLAIRQGDSNWQPLNVLFPEAIPQVAAFAPQAAPPVMPMPAVTAAPDAAPRLVRKNTLHRVIYGLLFLGSVIAFAGSLWYLKSMMGSSGDLTTDLKNMSWRILARDMAIAMFVATFFIFIGFLLSFKRKIIRSNGLRIAMRSVFVLIMLIGFAHFAYGAIASLNYSEPYRPSSSKSTERNELLDALNEGEAAAGPMGIATFHLPIAAALVLFGLSGVLMTKRGRPATD